jgi:hypothetical protein
MVFEDRISFAHRMPEISAPLHSLQNDMRPAKATG